MSVAPHLSDFHPEGNLAALERLAGAIEDRLTLSAPNTKKNIAEMTRDRFGDTLTPEDLHAGFAGMDAIDAEIATR